MNIYPIQVMKDDNGTLFITCPALPEVTTFAEDMSEVSKRAKDAIEEAIAARIADGREVPAPTVKFAMKQLRDRVVQMRTQVSMKIALYRELADAHITRAELSRRLDWKREQVDRLFRLNHATRLDQYDAAFHALGRDITIVVSPERKAVGTAEAENRCEPQEIGDPKGENRRCITDPSEKSAQPRNLPAQSWETVFRRSWGLLVARLEACTHRVHWRFAW